MSEETTECPHLDQIKVQRPKKVDGCVDCLKSGDTWMHLRMCKNCGYVGCCDNSKNKHMTKHNKANPSHPIMQSLEKDETWMWCFSCNLGWTMDYFSLD